MNIIIYDLEIIKGIPDRNGEKLPGIEYCKGWDDHANMGISTLCVYDYAEDRYRVFTEDNKDEWRDLYLSRRPVSVGFNSIPFDNRVLSATDGWLVPDDDVCYDILRETWKAVGLGPEFNYKTHGGFGLDAMCIANNLPGKTGNGALAPVMWQRGEVGKVIDYCLTDVHRTKLLFDLVLMRAPILNPKNKEQFLPLRHPRS